MRMKYLLALALVVFSGGCSIKFAYNNLDRLVRWQVSDYVDLNAEQRQLLKRELATLVSWHRRNHLPQYADFAEVMAVRLVDAPSAETFETMFVQIFAWADEVEAQAMPLVVQMMASLTDSQIAELRPRLAESNVELAEPEADLSLEEARERWAEEMIDGLRTFTGRLNREQRAYVHRRAATYRPQLQLWSGYRVRFQEALLTLLERRSDEAAFAREYAALIADRERFYGESLTAAFEHNRVLATDIAAHIFSGLSDRQVRHLVERLSGLGEDLRELSVQT